MFHIRQFCSQALDIIFLYLISKAVSSMLMRKDDLVCLQNSDVSFLLPPEDEWPRNDGTEHPSLLQILECVRLALVSPYFLVDVVEGETAVRSSPECRVIVEEARLFHLLPDRRHQLASPRTRHRRNTNTTTVSLSLTSLITGYLFLVTSSFTKTIIHHHK